jgi:OpgC protein
LDLQRDKYNLAPHRLLHFLSVALLVATYVSSNSAVFKWGGGFVVKTGQWSLPIFSIGAILSVFLTVAFAAHSFSFLEKLAFNLGAITVTALVAITLADSSQRRRTLRAEVSASGRNTATGPRARMVELIPRLILSHGIQAMTISAVRLLLGRRRAQVNLERL